MHLISLAALTSSEKLKVTTWCYLTSTVRLERYRVAVRPAASAEGGLLYCDETIDTDERRESMSWSCRPASLNTLEGQASQ